MSKNLSSIIGFILGLGFACFYTGDGEIKLFRILFIILISMVVCNLVEIIVQLSTKKKKRRKEKYQQKEMTNA
ncbi:MAG: hypothetical protein H7329_20225 [Opitutaceae bacterium]|nr:hypothetical protein [Cytophagales bacterium]